MKAIQLVEVSREVYGHDRTAINRHSTREYVDNNGTLWHLSRCLDAVPPYFEASGPFGENFCGILPCLLVGGKAYWGESMTWRQAEAMFRRAVIAKAEGGDRMSETILRVYLMPETPDTAAALYPIARATGGFYDGAASMGVRGFAFRYATRKAALAAKRYIGRRIACGRLAVAKAEGGAR